MAHARATSKASPSSISPKKDAEKRSGKASSSSPPTRGQEPLRAAEPVVGLGPVERGRPDGGEARSKLASGLMGVRPNRLLADCGVQPKLTVNEPGDSYEQEADRVAEQVMQMPGAMTGDTKAQPPVGRVQRMCPRCRRRHRQGKPLNCSECEAEVQRKENTGETATVDAEVQQQIRYLRGRGRPLPTSVRSFFEPRFGADFSKVRVHTGRRPAALNRQLGARAFTYGQDLFFGRREYRPGTPSGRQLLAHELTHVRQQATRFDPSGELVQRENDETNGDEPAKDTAASAPELEYKASKNGSPCACLVFVHNNERNARLTAQLMYENCSYNLAMVTPDTGTRNIKIPGKSSAVDPNALFPPDVAEECWTNERSCREFLKEHAGATDADVVEEYVQKQFFLAMKDCSVGFSLPVVALHNNDLKDTKQYLKEKKRKNVDDLKMDIDKTEETGEDSQDSVEKMKKLLRKKFGRGIVRSLTRKGKTNIFRWCEASALAKCHIGDPDHPDNVVWVTNEQDFERLSQTDVNVALQADLESAAGTKAEGDLSTLFLIMHGIIGQEFTQRVQQLVEEAQTDIDDIEAIIDGLQRLSEYGDLMASDLLGGLRELLVEVLDIIVNIALMVSTRTERRRVLERLRYLNIETPEKHLEGKTDGKGQEYEIIARTLDAVGLHCCDDTEGAEQRIKRGLRED